MKQEDLKIEKLTTAYQLGRYIYHDQIYDQQALKFIQERDHCGLKHLKIESRVLANTIAKAGLSFESINIIEVNQCAGFNSYRHPDLSDLNQFLAFDKIIDKKLFLIINGEFEKKYLENEYYNNSSLFTKLCKRLSNFISHAVPINVNITINDTDLNQTICKNYEKIYCSYFLDKNFLDNYRKPVSSDNKFFVPRTTLYTHFEVIIIGQSKYEKCLLKISNVQMC